MDIASRACCLPVAFRMQPSNKQPAERQIATSTAKECSVLDRSVNENSREYFVCSFHSVISVSGTVSQCGTKVAWTCL